jgi:hypothetical protein
MDSNNNDSSDSDAKSDEDSNINLSASHNNQPPLQFNLDNTQQFISPNIDNSRILNGNHIDILFNNMFNGNNNTPNNTPTTEQLMSELTTIFYNAMADNNIPATNVNEQFNNLLSQSFDEKPKYKTVLSEKGENNLKKCMFKDSNKTNPSCPIFCVDFEDDTEVTELPCKHIFTSTGIEKWLKEEKNECPVCRYKLDSIEVSVINSEDYDYDYDNDGLETKDEDIDNGEDSDIEMEYTDVVQPRTLNEMINNRQNLSASLTSAYNYRDIPNTFTRIINNMPHSYMQSIIEDEESKQLNEAILASLRDLENKKEENNDSNSINNDIDSIDNDIDSIDNDIDSFDNDID